MSLMSYPTELDRIFHEYTVLTLQSWTPVTAGIMCYMRKGEGESEVEYLSNIIPESLKIAKKHLSEISNCKSK